ncbi:hypothetical protein ACVFYP_12265 [Roseomonas sp. F4]
MPKQTAKRIARPDTGAWDNARRRIDLAHALATGTVLSPEELEAWRVNSLVGGFEAKIQAYAEGVAQLVGPAAAAGMLQAMADSFAAQAPKPRGPKKGQTRMAGRMAETELLAQFDNARIGSGARSERQTITRVADSYVSRGWLAEVGRDAFERRLQKLLLARRKKRNAAAAYLSDIVSRTAGRD